MVVRDLRKGAQARVTHFVQNWSRMAARFQGSHSVFGSTSSAPDKSEFGHGPTSQDPAVRPHLSLDQYLARFQLRTFAPLIVHVHLEDFPKKSTVPGIVLETEEVRDVIAAV